uniref:Uncharacterized protein n=1 Tax=Oryza rufipogon TaxID=4529 RepID=A0A0E0Q550_ORYRU
MRSTTAGPPRRWSTTTAATSARRSRRGAGSGRGQDRRRCHAAIHHRAVVPPCAVLPSAPAFVLPCWCCHRDKDDERTKTETAENVTDWTEIVIEWHGSYFKNLQWHPADNANMCGIFLICHICSGMDPINP